MAATMVQSGLEKLKGLLSKKSAHSNEKNAASKAPKNSDEKIKEKNKTPSIADYFQLAANWADDFYTAIQTSRNRWRAACLYGFLPVSGVLLVCVTFLIPLQHLAPVMVNHYGDGVVSVTPLNQPEPPHNQAMVESELVRYVVNRESYSAASYAATYSLTNLLSSDAVANTYQQQQSRSNKHSPINMLGDKGSKTVHIESIVFLDRFEQNPQDKNAHHRNLAQVDFTVSVHNGATDTTTKVPLTALISWVYTGIPTNPRILWQDWDGFMVTEYTVQQRNLS